MAPQILTLVLAVLASPAAAFAQADVPDLARQAQTLESDGKNMEALALYKKALAANPRQFEAHLGIGRVLDMEGQYAEARTHIRTAIELAPESGLNQALTTMGVAYAFEGNAAEAAAFYQKAFDRQMQAGAPNSAANTANALGRVYLETGDLGNAEKWYRAGYEAAKKASASSPGQSDLTEMRWHHAQARLAARRKQFDAARKHLDEVHAIVARGTLDESQQAQYPHLAGYVAFHQGRYDEAITALAKADQADPFILSLMAQAYEHKQDHARARELHARVLAQPGHSLQAAFSRPLARKRLEAR
jgi:tetratricopeptide (TPR) repeat protein